MTHRRRGQSTVELALTLPILLLLVLGIVDFGRVFLAANVISHGAGDSARYASLHGTGLDEPGRSAIRKVVIDEGARSAVTIKDINIDIVYLDGASGDAMTCYLSGSSIPTTPGAVPDCAGPPAPGRTYTAAPQPGDLVQVSVHLPWSAQTTLIQGVLPNGFTIDSTAASSVEQ